MGSDVPDGTQPLAPPALYPDPTAGLVTSDSDISASAFATRYDDLEVPIAQPVEADQEAIKAMTEAALADITQFESKTAGASSQRHSHTATPPGMVATPPRQPTSTRMRNALRSYPNLRDSGLSLPKPKLTRTTNNSSAVIVAIVLVVIFGIIAIQVVTGIIEAVSGGLR
ncbi:MAG: hypothetical protein GEV00_17540 [Actinophytocola sp.]|nr:hypothetical protein [Actinophytocola sp.]